jgi:hypothetical protein
MFDEKLSNKEENMIRALEESSSSSKVEESESSETVVVKKPVGPRVKVGPDGELIIDEQSLVSLFAATLALA